MLRSGFCRRGFFCFRIDGVLVRTAFQGYRLLTTCELHTGTGSGSSERARYSLSLSLSLSLCARARAHERERERESARMQSVRAARYVSPGHKQVGRTVRLLANTLISPYPPPPMFSVYARITSVLLLSLAFGKLESYVSKNRD